MTPEQQELLTRIGPGTPMGGLLRRYWVPVAASVDVTGGQVVPVRIMGEDLALFRTPAGALGLIDARCPHRGASLAYGLVEADALRCAYHGWCFDPTGRCVEIPVPRDSTTDVLRVQATTTAYPVRDLGGLVFAYLGPRPAPTLPRYDLFAWTGVLRDIGQATIPCNWLQIMENSVDPVHVEWLHGRHLTAVRTARGEQAPTRYARPHRTIDFEVFEHGIIKRRLLEGSAETDDDWQIGHPLVFPLMVRVGAHRQHRFQIRVPVDDTNTMLFWYSCYAPAAGAAPVEQDEVPVYDVPFLDERGRFLVDFVDGGDIMTWVTQGPIADRTRELLTATDRGVVLYRRLLLEQLDRVAQGDDPLGVLRGGEDKIIDLPQEREKYGDGAAFLAEALDASHARYSPLRNDIVALLAEST
jgi:5,5'-dehydrodivanillate O-demethylase oxygenase subunit